MVGLWSQLFRGPLFTFSVSVKELIVSLFKLFG